jgi:lipoprotein-anchoring transpeptidase ErfK/SrfK
MRGVLRLSIIAALAAASPAFAANDGLAILGLEAPPGPHGGLFEFLAARAPAEDHQPSTATAATPALVEPPQAAVSAPGAAVEPQSELEERFRRQEVDYVGPEAPGTIVIDTPEKFLFLVQPNGRAIRYGVGVGRPGFEWSGVKSVTRKTEWPDWTPPAQMLLRRPDLPTHMDGGPHNPLGARALYLGSSLYRIHGTNDPSTIGQNVSSGCIRMTNDDVIDLYNRVPVGAKVIVL